MKPTSKSLTNPSPASHRAGIGLFTFFLFCIAVLASIVLGARNTAAADNPYLRDCGNEDEEPCGVLERDVLNRPCDTGLTPISRLCWITTFDRGIRIWTPAQCPSCVIATRIRSKLDNFENSWVDWALRNQRESLAKDEPINWVQHLGAHNSFNTVSDGQTAFANQFFSITDQLRAGSRLVDLDVHWIAGSARLCHGGGAACLVYPGLRYYADGVKEIRNWCRVVFKAGLFCS